MTAQMGARLHNHNQSQTEMKASFPFVLLLLAGAFVTSSAAAQDTPTAPADTTMSTVADSTHHMMGSTHQADGVTNVEFVLAEAPDDLPVKLHGTLTASLGDERYTFEDETGTIQVHIDDDVFNPDLFTEGIEVHLVGEVDKDQGEETEVEVEFVELG